MDKFKQQTHLVMNNFCCSQGSPCVHSSQSPPKGEAVEMSDAEVDLIQRMHKLVGDRWALIAGRVPDRTPAEIQKYWESRKLGNTEKQPAPAAHLDAQHQLKLGS